MIMNIARISENELRTIVENVVRRFQMESIARYWLKPNQERAAEEIVLGNKRTVNNSETGCVLNCRIYLSSRISVESPIITNMGKV